MKETREVHDLEYLRQSGLRMLIYEQALTAGADDATGNLSGHIVAQGAALVASGAVDNALNGTGVDLADTVAELTRNADALSFIEQGIREAITILETPPAKKKHEHEPAKTAKK